MDRATRCVSQNLVNYRNKLYNKSIINHSNGVRGLQLIDFRKQVLLVDCRIGVVNKLDRQRRRRMLLTARSTCRGEIFYVRSFGQSPSRGTAVVVSVLLFRKKHFSEIFNS